MFFQSFSSNQQGRDFVIGDLHGMYDLLFKHLQAVNFDFGNTLFIDTGCYKTKHLTVLPLNELP